MPIEARCPGCGKEYQVKDDLAGKKFRCKQCQGVVAVPEAEAESADPWDVDLGTFQDQEPDDDDDFSAPLAPPRRGTGKKKSKSRSGGAQSDGKDGVAITALVLGCINLLSWCLPICGLPLSIGGIVCGILGMGSPTKRPLAIIGLILSMLGLIASIANAVIGAMMAMQGNHPLFQQ